MLENHYMLIVGPFQVSLLFSRTSELQEVGNTLLRTRNFKLFSVWWETAVASPLSLWGSTKKLWHVEVQKWAVFSCIPAVCFVFFFIFF